MDQEEINKQIFERLEKLEKTVFCEGRNVEKGHKKIRNFSGAKGGIMLLISQNFFNKKRNAPEVKTELIKHNYHYSIQVVQTALNRFSKPAGPLVAFKEGGKKVYAKRK